MYKNHQNYIVDFIKNSVLNKSVEKVVSLLIKAVKGAEEWVPYDYLSDEAKCKIIGLKTIAKPFLIVTDKSSEIEKSAKSLIDLLRTILLREGELLVDQSTR
jgi:hypothetical protein